MVPGSAKTSRQARSISTPEKAHPLTGDAHFNFAIFMEAKGDMDAALHHLRAAARTYEQCYGVEHAETLDARERIARLAES